MQASPVPGDAELVAHADGEDRNGVLLCGDVADRVREAADDAVLLGGNGNARLCDATRGRTRSGWA